MKKLLAILVLASLTMFACNANNDSTAVSKDSAKAQEVLIKQSVRSDTVHPAVYEYLDNNVLKLDTAGYAVVTSWLSEAQGMPYKVDSLRVTKILDAKKQEVKFHRNEQAPIPEYVMQFVKTIQRINENIKEIQEEKRKGLKPGVNISDSGITILNK